MSRIDVVRAIEQSGVVAVIRLKDARKLRSVVDALIEGGVTAMEVTMTVPGALLTFGVTRRVNFSVAPVVPDVVSIPMIVRAASVERVFMFLPPINASDRPFVL